MSTDRETLVALLASVDFRSDHVGSGQMDSAIEEFVTSDAVGVVDEGWCGELPESVNWEPTPADLQAVETGVTPVAFAVADYGLARVDNRVSRGRTYQFIRRPPRCNPLRDGRHP